MIAAGGPLGSVAVTLAAPLVFSSFVEWKLALVGGFVLAAVLGLGGIRQAVVGGDRATCAAKGPWQLSAALRAGGALLAIGALVEIVHLLTSDELSNRALLAQVRNFYGVLSVADEHPDSPSEHTRALYHGLTTHGTQLLAADLRETPVAYYIAESGIGQVLTFYGERGPLRLGVVGQGAGALAAYLRKPGDAVRFYEINPEVPRLADAYFTYLADAKRRGATIETVLGDARLALERESSTPQQFDVLVLDAFSGDAIPNHLLTREAFAIFVPHLKSDGAMAVHISNRYLDLAPVVYGLAEHFGLEARRVFSVDVKHGGWGADWIILSKNRQLLDALHQVEGSIPRDPPKPPFPLWTDQQHNLLEVLR